MASGLDSGLSNCLDSGLQWGLEPGVVAAVNPIEGQLVCVTQGYSLIHRRAHSSALILVVGGSRYPCSFGEGCL